MDDEACVQMWVDHECKGAQKVAYRERLKSRRFKIRHSGEPALELT